MDEDRGKGWRDLLLPNALRPGGRYPSGYAGRCDRHGDQVPPGHRSEGRHRTQGSGPRTGQPLARRARDILGGRDQTVGRSENLGRPLPPPLFLNVISFVALCFFSLPILFISLLVKITSKGPILYWSNRV